MLLGLVIGVVVVWKCGWWDRGFFWLFNMLLVMFGLILVLLFGVMVLGFFFIFYFVIVLMLWVEFFCVVCSKIFLLFE